MTQEEYNKLPSAIYQAQAYEDYLIIREYFQLKKEQELFTGKLLKAVEERLLIIEPKFKKAMSRKMEFKKAANLQAVEIVIKEVYGYAGIKEEVIYVSNIMLDKIYSLLHSDVTLPTIKSYFKELYPAHRYKFEIDKPQGAKGIDDKVIKIIQGLKEKGVKQKEAAKIANVSLSTVQRNWK